ncbi:hypothetical protein DFJ73DRAFT_891098, partial [Zopfochytrium polystomum]
SEKERSDRLGESDGSLVVADGNERAGDNVKGNVGSSSVLPQHLGDLEDGQVRARLDLGRVLAAKGRDGETQTGRDQVGLSHGAEDGGRVQALVGGGSVDGEEAKVDGERVEDLDDGVGALGSGCAGGDVDVEGLDNVRADAVDGDGAVDAGRGLGDGDGGDLVGGECRQDGDGGVGGGAGGGGPRRDGLDRGGAGLGDGGDRQGAGAEADRVGRVAKGEGDSGARVGGVIGNVDCELEGQGGGGRVGGLNLGDGRRDNGGLGGGGQGEERGEELHYFCEGRMGSA